MKIADFSVINFADLERNPLDPINHIDMKTPLREQIAANTKSVDANTAVVVQLGDNAPSETMADFGPAYNALLDAVSVRTKLVCVSTWWLVAAKDVIIKAACEAHGGRYVYIGDLKANPANRDLLEGPQWVRQDINSHPHDWSMARIAERVLPALMR